MIHYRVEPASDVLRDGSALFTAHSQEQVHNGFAINLDTNTYCQADAAGLLRVFTARDETKLVGYACFFVARSLRHAILEATQDSLYLAPAYRGGTIGVRFMRFIESSLRAEGVIVLRQHTHPGTTMDGMMPKMGYEHAHNEWEKRLDKE